VRNAQNKMTITKLLTTITVLAIMTSCALFDSGGETIKGRYNVVWIDTKANRSINYAAEDGDYGGSEKVGAFIKRLGHNDRYIIAERIYFDVFERMDKPDYDSTAYYIIDMDIDAPYDNKDVMGPLNRIDFEKMKTKLGIEGLEFTKEYYDY